MPKTPLDPDVADRAPEDPVVTAYDREHLITYLRLLDAETDRAEWCEVARLVLHRDPDVDPVRARTAWESHLARAHWLRNSGYKDLLRQK